MGTYLSLSETHVTPKLNGVKPIQKEEPMDIQEITLEEIDTDSVKSLHLDALCQEVNTGKRVLKEVVSPQYILKKNTSFFHVQMEKARKANRKEIAKKW